MYVYCTYTYIFIHAHTHTHACITYMLKVMQSLSLKFPVECS